MKRDDKKGIGFAGQMVLEIEKSDQDLYTAEILEYENSLHDSYHDVMSKIIDLFNEKGFCFNGEVKRHVQYLYSEGLRYFKHYIIYIDKLQSIGESPSDGDLNIIKEIKTELRDDLKENYKSIEVIKAMSDKYKTAIENLTIRNELETSWDFLGLNKPYISSSLTPPEIGSQMEMETDEEEEKILNEIEEEVNGIRRDYKLSDIDLGIVLNYVKSPADLINFIKVSKNAQSMLLKLFYNPIDTSTVEKFFPNIQTQHFYLKVPKKTELLDGIHEYIVHPPIVYADYATNSYGYTKQQLERLTFNEIAYNGVDPGDKIVFHYKYPRFDYCIKGSRRVDKPTNTDLYMKIKKSNGIVNVPDPCTTVCSYCFHCMPNIKLVTLPNSLKSIGIGSFEYSGIETIIIPEGVTSIGESAFHECSNLTSIKLPDGLQSIGKKAFCNTSIESIIIPKHVSYIGKEALVIRKLRNITFLTTELREFSDSMLRNTGIKSITIPDGVTAIRYSCFADCEELTHVNLGKVKILDSHCFYECKSLKEIDITWVEAIEDSCFENCDLERIAIGPSIRTIGIKAFRGKMIKRIIIQKGISDSDLADIIDIMYEITNDSFCYNYDSDLNINGFRR